MPKFKKNTDYSMRGSEFYGKGNQSPLKVSDESVVEAQRKLSEVEHGWRTPSWAKGVKKIFGGVGDKVKAAIGGAKGDAGGSAKSGGSSKLNINQDIMDDNLKIEY